MAFGSGRTGAGGPLQPEIVEVIRSLDVPALLLNNLSLEGKPGGREPETHQEAEEEVVLRRKVNCLERKTRSLYERRLPKVPKLHLQVAGKKPASEEEELRTFQVQAGPTFTVGPSICRLSRVLFRSQCSLCVENVAVIHFRLHFHSLIDTEPAPARDLTCSYYKSAAYEHAAHKSESESEFGVGGGEQFYFNLSSFGRHTRRHGARIW